MSSHARRSLRTTAAAAGIAAIGVGIAAPAMAAPETSPVGDGTAAEALAPAAAGPAAGLLGKIPALPNNVADLPMLFTFQGPTFNTAGPALPVVEPAASEEAAPAEASPLPDPGQLTQQNNISGLPKTDALDLVKNLAGKAMSAAPLH